MGEQTRHPPFAPLATDRLAAEIDSAILLLHVIEDVASIARKPAELFADPDLIIRHRPNGDRILRSGIELPDAIPRCVGDWLEHWAAVQPDEVFLAERNAAGEWDRLSYGEARRRVVAIAILAARAEALGRAAGGDPLRQRHRARPAGAGGDARRRAGGADLAGQLADVEGLRQAARQLRAAAPGRGLRRSGRALHAGDRCGGRPARRRRRRRQPQPAAARHVLPFGADRAAQAAAKADEAAVMAAFAARRPDTIAKFLFTSGSVGTPKAVINTQRMMCSNQLAKELVWPFLRSTRRCVRVAAVEPHLRRQPRLQHGAALGRQLLHRRRQAHARADRQDPAQPARGVADDLLQRAARLRHAGARTCARTPPCANASSAACR
jgi:hypothetical protein